MTQRIVVVTDTETGQSGRVNLSGAVDLDLSQRDYGTGIDLVAVYLQPRAQRVIIHTYSRWDDGRGRVRGDSYTIANNDQIAQLARRFRCDELEALLPEFTDQ